MSKIKILSGWSNSGGSSTAFINLTNLFNKNGYDCTFYGPHDWHLNKCKSGKIADVSLTKDDNLIMHFLNIFQKRPPVQNFILSLHETELFDLKKVNLIYDKVHFVSETQRKWHGIEYPHFVLPNVVEELRVNTKPKGKVAGIIGTIDENKQTGISIQRAINDKCDKILVYGNVTDQRYYDTFVKQYIKTVRFMGYEEDKQRMYDSITDCYLSSKLETWSYIKTECDRTGTKFHGCKAVEGNHILTMTNEEILKEWVRQLGF